ncbi:MAG: hypothetical protein KA792_10450 [Bacteroidales bacterium]|nr:hypothetical protein [Bacteroidales bacterium]
MAKFKNSDLISDIRGSVGDKTYSRNRSGAYLKQKSKKKYKITPARKQAMNKLSEVMSAWNDLSPEDYNKWSLLNNQLRNTSSYYKNKRLSIVSLFVKLNRNLLEVGMQVKKQPGRPDFPPLLNKVKIELRREEKDWDLLLHFQPELTENFRILLFATAPMNFKINSIKETAYKVIAVLDAGFKPGMSIKSFYFNKFQCEPGFRDKVCVKLKAIALESGLNSSIVSIESSD